MGWVLLKRIHPKIEDVILVEERAYIEAGTSKGDWQFLTRGNDADYEMLLNMAKLTENYVELAVNREKNIDLYYEKKGHNNVS